MLRQITEEELRNQIEITLRRMKETTEYSDQLYELDFDTDNQKYWELVEKEEESNVASYSWWDSVKESNWGNMGKIRYLIGSCYTFNHDVAAASVLNVIKEVM